MKKFLLVFLFFLISLLMGFCQSPVWTWAKEAYTTNSEFAKDIAIDPTNGDIVVVGDFTGDISAFYGNQFIGAIGGGFVAKYNSSGTLIWAFKIGESDNDDCHAVAIDASGNIYVVGQLTLSCDFKGNSPGPNSLTSVGGKDAFIAKYNSAGLFQWVKKGGGANNDEAYAVCVDNSKVYITGYYKNVATFGTLNTHSAENHDDIFVVAYDLNGNEQWLADVGATGDGYGYDVISDNNDVFVTCSFKGAITIYNGSGASVSSPVTLGNWEGLIMSLSNVGNFNWGSLVTGGGANMSYSITENGSFVYITGSTQSNTTFSGFTGNPVIPLGSGVDFYLAQLNKSNGLTQWVKCESGNNDQEGMQVAIDGNNNILVTGYLNNDISFAGGPTLTSAGNFDIFVANYTNAGVFQWAKQAGGGDKDIPYGIASINTIESYIVGEYKSAATFGTYTLFNENSINIFVAKLGCPPITNNTISAAQTICEGQTPVVLNGSAPSGGSTPYTYLWEQSPDNFTWSSASGTNNLQNYSPPTLYTNTYYRRTVTSTGSCTNNSISSSILITVNALPTTANAGSDQSVCATAATLAGNTPAIGTGVWTLITGTGTITTPGSPSSGLTGLGIGANTFRWTITNGVCASSTDDVIITSDASPTLANAGPDQTLCASVATLAGNAPVIGTGVWTLITGTGTITTPSSPTSGLTGLGIGVNTFRWTITNGVCASSSDDVIITQDDVPTNASAGPDQTLCATVATLAGNNPAIGNGTWTLVSGTGTITSPGSPNSGLTGLGVGANTFRWTITNGTCSPSSDDVIITKDANPTAANAGPDQTICASAAALAGNTPAIGTGNWTLITGTGTITTPGSPTSGLTGLGIGANTFRWTISNGVCASSSDDVIITQDDIPTTASAGPDQTLCATIASLAGNTPVVGTGNWTIVTGSGTITTPGSPTSGLTGLGVGTNTFRWTISNGVCASSSDDVIITRDDVPTAANAGPNQTICSTAATLAGNTPITGTGVWTLITGTGLITSPGLPNSGLTGLGVGTNTFRWTISNGVCASSSDDVIITRDAVPTAASAGPDQSICATVATLAGNTPAIGTGNWTIVTGSGTITSPGSPTSGLTGLGVGANTFRWTITNGVCASSSDDVIITRDAIPTPANAGPNQTICSTTATLAGNTPATGTGVWTIVTGTGTITASGSPNSGLTGLGVGANTFRWTISNGVCASSSDDVIITRDAVPTAASAGPDQTVCATVATLAGNTPTIGTGIWTLVTGIGTITSPVSPTSGLTGLGVGTNTFRWTITNGVCASSSDDVIITRDAIPTTANAGPDQTICATATTLAGNTAVIGTGTWTLVTGTGTITSPGSPTSGITGLGIGANTFRWTISNGVCASTSDDVIITRDAVPTAANAGPDQTICTTVATLAGNTHVVGTGIWTLITGTGTITTPGSPTSGLTGLGVGSNTFRWTIINGVCASSSDDVIITRDAVPTTSNAGPDQTVCASITALAGNTPVIGTGLWTLITGTGTITTPGSPTSGITGLGVGTNTFRWTITNGVCAISSDDVIINIDANPTISNAGPDQTICSSVTTLAGNTPAVGTGTWTIVSGTGTITSPSSPTSGLTGLGIGSNTFRWTITNGVCAISSDDVIINVDEVPTVAIAGPLQTICSTTTNLAGNTPVIGTGIWTLVTGIGTITAPGSPTTSLTGLGIGANTFRWTISNGVCAVSFDEVIINVDANPTNANAGPDQTICSSVTSLAGNTPAIGTGTWTLVAGSGSITSPSTTTSGLTGLGVGANTFRWTITNGVCASSSDDVIITRDAIPTPAIAGPDQIVCSTSSTLAGNNPAIGSGTWTLVAGTGTITTPGSPSSGLTGLGVGANTFRWTITNGVCASSSDDVIITRDAVPTVPSAGPDQTVCATFTTLAGNSPAIGTGTWTLVTGTGTITSPGLPTSGLTGLGVGANTFRWTISNGVCASSSDDVIITRDAVPTAASAGPDQTICATFATLAGNTPAIGTGFWTLVAGTGTITSPGSPSSGLTGLGVGANTFRWTITNGVCASSSDDVIITRDAIPTPASAGPDQTVCATVATLAGNTPVIGTGIWTLITGTGTITTPGSPNSGLTGLGVGANTFRWTITNGVCALSSDDVIITRDAVPTIASAGPDQSICATVATLAGNTPTIGTGIWTLVTGTGTITTPGSSTSGLTGLGVGANTFRWTITNGVCASNSDDVIITRYAIPTTANAGPDQTICATIATLTGNTPAIGTGIWTLVTGTGTITTPGSPTSGLTGLGVGANTFRWTITNGVCASTSDDVIITRDAVPTIASAGPDQSRCATVATLAGNTPTIGTGIWTLVTGTGTITTPGSPTSGITGLGVGTNTFRWTILNGVCASTYDDVIITRDAIPTSANAGPNQTICSTSATLAGNSPAIGTGIWTLVTGIATITTPGSPTSGLTGLGIGANTFRWTISNGVCANSFDEVIINVDANPTNANAGPDQTICSSVTTLAGNSPVIGTGIWTLVTGTGTITTPGSPTSSLTGLGTGINKFKWTISNGVCAISFDEVIIIVDAVPSVAIAGPLQTICSATTNLAGNIPVIGTGIWTLITGTGTITTPGSPTSGLTGLGIGANTFRWTISNGVCANSFDEVIINVDANPTTAIAGPDQTICSSVTSLSGNTPVIGTGIWTLVSGTGSITTPGSPSTGLTGLATGANTFRWTTSNGVCASTSDDIIVNVDAVPTVAIAGPAQTICSANASLAGNTPVIGTGLWTLVTGTGVITTPDSPVSGLTGLVVGSSTFRWTITNGVCASSFDEVVINVDANPTIANAGPDQTICLDNTTLAGNIPAIGTGTWTLVTGTGTITIPGSPSSGLTGLVVGANTFQWTTTNGVCASTSDNVIINVDDNPTVADAGPDQTICLDNTTLAGNIPAIGTGTWTLVTGTGTITIPGSPSSGLTGLVVGANTFQWTTTNGVCASTSDNVIINVDANPTVADAGPDQTICLDNTTLAGNIPTIGTGTWTLVTGTGIITIPGSPFSGLTGLVVGANTFQWTTSNGVCASTSDNVIINVDANPTVADAGPDQTICLDNTTLAGNIPAIGTGTWTLVTGTGTITIPGSPSSGLTGLVVGANTFQWTTTNGVCASTSDNVIINVDANPTTADAGSDYHICIDTASLFGNSPAIGTGVWTLVTGTGNITLPSSPLSGLSGLVVGPNTFQWTISNGVCPPSSDQIIITVDAFPTTADAGPDQTICSPTSAFEGNTPIIGIGSWSLLSGTGTITSPLSSNSPILGMSVGQNDFVWTISNGTCVPSTDTVTINIDPFPTTANAGTDYSICTDSSSLFGNNPTIGSGIWTLVIGTGNITLPSSPLSGLSGLVVGPNTFQWTISNGVCPPSSDQIIITVDAFPTTADAGPDQTICSPTSAFEGNTPIIGIGSWSLLSGTGTITSPLSSNSPILGMSVGQNDFVWTISNGTCVPSTDTVTINIDPFPTTAIAGTDYSICTDTASLYGNTPAIGSGIWTLVTGTGTITLPSSPLSGLSGLVVGPNTLQWTITNGVCPPSSDQITINVDALPTNSNAGQDQTMCINNTIIEGNVPQIGIGSWTLISGSGNITSPTSTITNITDLQVGQNIFVWTITNGTCAPSTDSVIISIDPYPTIADAGQDHSICFSSIVFAANTPITGTGTWTLLSGSGNIFAPNSPTLIVSGLSLGPNEFIWTISSGTCPPSSDTVTITVDSYPSAALAGPNQAICTLNTNLNAITPISGTGFWSLFSGTGQITNPSSPTSSITGLSPGSNIFIWTVSNGTCMPTSDSVTIYINPIPTTSNAGEDQTICASSSMLTGNSPIIGTGEWTLVSGSGTIDIPTSPTSSVSNLIVGSATFRWTISTSLCPTSYDDIVITVDDFPSDANAGVDITTFSTIADLNANNPIVGNGSWSVSSGNAIFENNNDPLTIASSLQVGPNIIRWTISNGVCPDSYDELLVTVNEVKIPNGFSPNGDNVNDYFEIPGLMSQYNNVHLNVFNRWGNLVYTNNDYRNNWDGKNMDGEDISDDTYYFTLVLSSEETVTGFIVIKRK